MAAGSMWKVFAGCFHPLYDLSDLSYMGFVTTLTPADFKLLRIGSPVVAEEDEWASRCARLALECVAHLLRAALTWMDSYPGSLAALLNGDSQVQQQRLEQAKVDWHAFLAARRQNIPQIKNMVKQSFFQQVHVVECMYMLSRANFERVPADLRRRLELNFCMVGTQVIEHSFRDERVSENRDNENKVMGSTKKWAIPIQAEVLTAKHHYREVDWQSQEIDPSLVPGNITSLFIPPQSDKKMSMPMPALVTERPPTWPTFSPMRVAVQSAELAVFRAYHLSGHWHRARFLWLSVLARAGMVLRKVGSQALADIRSCGVPVQVVNKPLIARGAGGRPNLICAGSSLAGAWPCIAPACSESAAYLGQLTMFVRVFAFWIVPRSVSARCCKGPNPYGVYGSACPSARPLSLVTRTTLGLDPSGRQRRTCYGPGLGSDGPVAQRTLGR